MQKKKWNIKVLKDEWIDGAKTGAEVFTNTLCRVRTSGDSFTCCFRTKAHLVRRPVLMLVGILDAGRGRSPLLLPPSSAVSSKWHPERRTASHSGHRAQRAQPHGCFPKVAFCFSQDCNLKLEEAT